MEIFRHNVDYKCSIFPTNYKLLSINLKDAPTTRKKGLEDKRLLLNKPLFPHIFLYWASILYRHFFAIIYLKIGSGTEEPEFA